MRRSFSSESIIGEPAPGCATRILALSENALWLPGPAHLTTTKRETLVTADSAVLPVTEPKRYRAILVAGLAAGVLDITAAFVNSGLRGTSPMRVLQSIASGLLGAESYAGGLPTASLGLVVHFLIAFVAASVYYLASRRVEFLIERAVISGLLYGVAVYFFMYAAVLPLTFHRSFLQPFSAVPTGLAIHMFCVGLPISLVVRRFSKQ